MGRPKVHPANRLRANTACTTCRVSKKRCSGSFPCTNCIQKGRSGSCIPFKSTSDNGVRNRSLAAALPRTTEANMTWISPNDHVRSPFTQIHALSSAGDRFEGSPDAGSHSPEATHHTHPRMLRNLQGEHVYVGKAASLSFLQLLRDTVTQHIGPSQFSHNVKNEDMLETEAHQDLLDFSEDCCSLEQKRQFLQTFYTATSGLIFLGDDIDTLVAASSEPSGDREKIKAAIKDLVLAIGAQSCVNDPETIQIERALFARGQRRAFSNLLEDPGINIVRAFLLMSFYMFGACRRNAAFMYLGVAARSAVALGLHETCSNSLSDGEQAKRSRIWMSLCVIDLLASSILGRPAATAALLRDGRHGLPSMVATPVESRLFWSYRLSIITQDIVGRLYTDKTASADTASTFLERLNCWSEQLPDSLRTSSHSGDCSAVQEHSIGNLHVACSYHFAVILVTRPFLISTLGVRIARLHQSHSTGEVYAMLEEDPATSRLATACIDSAIYMLQTCSEVHQSHLLLQNMGILKAFIFAAALILGFSMFSHRDIDPEIDAAFTAALTILRMLARQSAQAAHYLEILTLLQGAVTQQRQLLTAQARQRRSQYVSRIFSLNDGLSKPNSEIEEESNGVSNSLHGGSLYPWAPPEEDVAFLDWGGMELPLWDMFPFTEPGSSAL